MALPPFDQVVLLHAPAVLRVCRALVGAQDAEDACSDTFLAALKAYPRLPEGSNVRAWLVTIAHHRSIDRRRAAGRAPIVTDRLPELAAPTSAPLDPDGAIWDSVRALPPKQRGAVAYHYLADLPYSEVAVLLGTSVAAARRSAADGIAALRSAFPREAQR